MKELHKADGSVLGKVISAVIYSAVALLLSYIIISVADGALGGGWEWNFFRVALETVKGGR